ncbi:MAG: hypothetical protein DME82_16200 [Verrucomicrobia bacterium]|nr:MAG: hypothetical protein DME82_16200 [Verrucomicrobiota bacterium]
MEKIQSSSIEARGISNWARASARFTVRGERTLEMTGLLLFRRLKRRERRAPPSAQSSCHLHETQ